MENKMQGNDYDNTAVIISAAPIEDYDEVKSVLVKNNIIGTEGQANAGIIIYCDAGLNHEEKLGLKPDLIVGDFDSHDAPDRSVETVRLNVMKDDTDTLHAVKMALERGYRSFVFIGAIGRRFDHSFANISILMYLRSHGAKGMIIDDYSEIELVGDEPAYIDDSYPYYSLMAVSGRAEGVYEENALYPLENATITQDYQYGISNEVLKGQQAKVWCNKGLLLLIKVRRN